MNIVKNISILLFSVMFVIAPAMNPFSFDQSLEKVDACCVSEVTESMSNHHSKQQDIPLTKDCNDCDDHCNDSGCHSLVPVSLNMKFPKNQAYISSIPIFVEKNVIYSWDDDFITKDFSHSIWHPPKV